MSYSIGVSPNTSWRDFFIALKSFFYVSTTELEIKNLIAKKLDTDSDIYLFASAREALWSYLEYQRTKVDASTEPIIFTQAITCVALVNAIKFSGFVPYFLDVDDKSFNIDPEDLKKADKTYAKGLVFQHTLGSSCNFDEVKTYCRKNNLFLVEDCAHLLGGKHFQNFQGTLSDAAVFSFGRDKALSCVEGGMLLINSDLQGYKAFFETQSYQEARSLKPLLHPILMHPAVLVYNFFSIGKIFIFILRLFKIISPPLTQNELQGNKDFNSPRLINPRFFDLLRHQILKIDQMNNHRTVTFQKYKSNLKSIEFQKFEEGNIPLRASFITEKRDEIIKSARDHSFGILFTLISPLTKNLEKFGLIQSLPTARKINNKILNLPLHIRLKSKDVEKIIKEIQNV